MWCWRKSVYRKKRKTSKHYSTGFHWIQMQQVSSSISFSILSCSVCLVLWDELSALPSPYAIHPLPPLPAVLVSPLTSVSSPATEQLISDLIFTVLELWFLGELFNARDVMGVVLLVNKAFVVAFQRMMRGFNIKRCGVFWCDI